MDERISKWLFDIKMAIDELRVILQMNPTIFSNTEII